MNLNLLLENRLNKNRQKPKPNKIPLKTKKVLMRSKKQSEIKQANTVLVESFNR